MYAHCGLDSTSQTNVDRWLNYVQQDLVSRWPWTFMRGRETIVTVADKTAGTVSVTSGSTALTGVSTAFATADTGSFIQLKGANDWYKVTFVSSTALTLATAYQPTANLTSGTYTLRKMFYSLSSSADKILDIRNWNTPMKLVQVDPRTLDASMPLAQSTNSPYAYMAYGVDSSGNIQISPYPFPNDARLFEVRTVTRPTDGSISIPNKYAHIIAWGAIAVGFGFLRKFQEAALWSQKYEQKITEMKKIDRGSEDSQPILRSIDEWRRPSLWQNLGDQFPSVTGG